MYKQFVSATLLVSALACKTSNQSEQTTLSSDQFAADFLSDDVRRMNPRAESGPHCAASPRRLGFTKSPNFSWQDAYSLLWLGWSNLDVTDEYNSGQLSMFADWQFDRYKISENRGSKYSMVFTNEAIYLTFRHSKAITNWLRNLDMRPTGVRNQAEFSLGVTDIHKGFYDSLNLIWPQILTDMKVFNPEAKIPIVLAGHSLGAAQAELAAVGLIKKGYKVRNLYLSGAPRVAGKQWNRLAGELKTADGKPLRERVYRVTNQSDIIARVPTHKDATSILVQIPRALTTNQIPDLQLRNATDSVLKFIVSRAGDTLNIPTYDAIGVHHQLAGSGKVNNSRRAEGATDVDFWQRRLDELNTLPNAKVKADEFSRHLSYHFVRYKTGYVCSMLRYFLNEGIAKE